MQIAGHNSGSYDCGYRKAAERDNMDKKAYCLSHPALATYAETAFSGIAIHGVEYDVCESYLYISRTDGTKTTYHRVKVHDGVYGSTFRVGDRTYKTADVIRID